MSGAGIAITLGANAAIGAGLAGGAKYLWDNAGRDEGRASMRAAATQAAGAEAGQGTIRDATQGAQAGLQPYQQAGTNALQMQQALAGSLGPEAQAQAYAALQGSPMFAQMLQQEETGILQNASATGGLRGGNTQQALATLGPQLLQQLAMQQYSQLAGLSSQGLGAAGQSGQFGMSGAGGIAGLQQDAAAYNAGGILGNQAAVTAGRNQLINYGMQGAGLGLQLATGMPIGGLAAAGGGGAPAAPMTQGSTPTWSY